ncbi:MAG: hypothetical protein F4X99_21415 [Gammaproteobacteria bacterium]|nr:hypothetical protein [Gammaproteobacteria bacterium]
MLADLLRIKRRREDDAVAAVAEAKAALERRREACRAKERELEEYRTWQVAEKERLYAKVHHRNVTKDILEKYREQLGMIRQRELQIEEERTQAEREAADAQGTLERAQQRRIEAHREVVKFEEYQQTLDAERLRDAQRKEDEETEDVVSSRFRT